MNNKGIICDVTKKHDYVLVVDCLNGNPNGDADMDGMPRIDPETQIGKITDGAVKRKFRNYVDATKNWQEPYRIYVQNRNYALNTLQQEAYEALKMKPAGAKIKREDEDKVKEWMCRNYWDIRMYGAAMSTKVSAGIVTGPMQVTFMDSIDRVNPMPVTITRVAVTRPEELKKSGDDDGEGGSGKSNEMGRKYIIPYGCYRGYGFFTPFFAERTGVTPDDMALYWEAAERMFDLDRSAARGLMAVRGIYIFTHESATGNFPAHKLFEKVQINKKSDVEFPRSYSDYDVNVDEKMPEGVTLTVLAA